MGENARRNKIFWANPTLGEQRPDFSALLPKAPDFEPVAKYGWICFCVFNDLGEVVDMISLNKDGTKGYSTAFGELDFARLQTAKEMFGELYASRFTKRIVNSSLLH